MDMAARILILACVIAAWLTKTNFAPLPVPPLPVASWPMADLGAVVTLPSSDLCVLEAASADSQGAHPSQPLIYVDAAALYLEAPDFDTLLQALASSAARIAEEVAIIGLEVNFKTEAIVCLVGPSAASMRWRLALKPPTSEPPDPSPPRRQPEASAQVMRTRAPLPGSNDAAAH